jgi:hypothetical protein
VRQLSTIYFSTNHKLLDVPLPTPELPELFFVDDFVRFEVLVVELFFVAFKRQRNKKHRTGMVSTNNKITNGKYNNSLKSYQTLQWCF